MNEIINDIYLGSDLYDTLDSIKERLLVMITIHGKDLKYKLVFSELDEETSK